MNKRLAVPWLYFCALVLLQGCNGDHQAKTTKTGTAAGPVPFEVLQIDERSHHDAPALAVQFSRPLDSGTRYDAYLQVKDPNGIVKGAWSLSEDGHVLYFPHVKPQTRYQVQVSAGLPSAARAPLPAGRQTSVTTRAVAPSVAFASTGLLLPKALSRGLPVVTVNVPTVDLEFYRFHDDQLAAAGNLMAQNGRLSNWQLEKLTTVAEQVFSGRFDLDPPANTRTTRFIALADVKGLSQPGLYLAVMRRPGQYGYQYKACYFFISDVGLQARVYRDRTLIVASSLRTGEPLPGVEVRVRDRDGWTPFQGRTDAQGRWSVPDKLNGRVIIQARYDRDVTFLPMDGPALDLSAFTLGQRKHRAQDAFAYGPRDLYRAGETVPVSLLLRDDDGRPVPEPALHARLIRPDRVIDREFVWQPQDLSGGGYYQTRLKLGPDAPSGQWQLEVRADPRARQPLQVYPFQVQDFMPERMKLTLDSPDTPLTPADSADVNITGAYLYGAPAAGSNVDASVQVLPQALLFPRKWPDFTFGDARTRAPDDRFDLDKRSLDDQGHGTLSLASRWADTRVPLRLAFTVNLYEDGGRPVTRSVNRQVWPASALVGIKLLANDDGGVDPGVVKLQLLKADADGILQSAQGLQLKLIRDERDYYWAYSDAEGWHYDFSPREYPLDQRLLNLDSKRPASVAFDLEWGQYRLQVTDPQTGLVSSRSFRVGWWSWDQGSGQAQPDKVSLKLDRKAYSGGDTATLTLVPPHAGNALVTVESDQLLWSTRVAVPAKGTRVSIPIDPAWQRHDLFISAAVFRPGDARDRITPNRAIGLIPLPLDRSQRRLEVRLDAPAKTQPNQGLDIPVQVAGVVPGQRAYLTLAAVDSGILSLTDFPTPRPWQAFFGQRRYGVEIHDIYDRVIELMEGEPARLRFGGDADRVNASQRARSRVRFVSLFSGPVPLDDQGRGSVHLDLPDFNGELRLMAVAFSADRFGSAEQTLTVAAPLVAELSRPRFIASGDQASLALDLHNLSGQAQTLRYQLSASAPLVIGQGEGQLALADGGHEVLHFPLTAQTSGRATASIELTITSDSLKLHRQWQLDVRPPFASIQHRLLATLEPGARFRIDPALVKGLSPEGFASALSVSSRPPLNLAEALHGLLAYPYGCLEQTTSSAYPLLFADPAAQQRFGLAPLTDADRAQRIESAFRRLRRMQLPSGGFGLWDNHSPEEPWLTAYASQFLLDARDQGFAVPPEMLDAALQRLQIYLQRGLAANLLARLHEDDDSPSAFAVDSYAAFVLARVNRVPLGTLRTLAERQDPSSGALALAHLGIALTLQGDQDRGRETLRLAAQRLDSDGDDHDRGNYRVNYGSPVRDTALMIALRQRYAPDAALEGRLLVRLNERLVDQRWLSTQERFALFMAGLAGAELGRQDFSVSLDRAGEQDQHSGQDLHLQPDYASLAAGISLSNTGPQPVYLDATLSGYPTRAPAPEAAPIRISREYFHPDGSPLGDSPLRSGELVLVHLRVSADQAIPDLLVEDLLPAGLEPENQGLAHTVKLADLRLDSTPVAELLSHNDISHEEYRDDRYAAALHLDAHWPQHLLYLVRAVTPGHYQVPPPRASAMYRPALHGIGTAPAQLTVMP